MSWIFLLDFPFDGCPEFLDRLRPQSGEISSDFRLSKALIWVQSGITLTLYILGEGMASVWDELRRRNVVRVAIAYAIVSWLILQITDVLTTLLHLPEWVGGFVFLLLVIGFLLALILSWAYELTPEGLKKEKDIERSESITHVTGRKLDFVIIGLLTVALGYFAYDKFVAGPVEPQDSIKSIAVLAFDNMSDDPGNEYFSDGISEEILNLLVKVPELRVTSRSSEKYSST